MYLHILTYLPGRALSVLWGTRAQIFLSFITLGRAPYCICIVNQLLYIVLYWTPEHETSLMP